MPIPVVLALAAAGALAGAGLGATAGGVLMWKRGNQQAAEELVAGDIDALMRLLEREIDLVQLRRQAVELGVDVAAVEAGYKAYRDGQADLEEIARGVFGGAHIVPTTSEVAPEKLKELVGGDTEVVSERQMRGWLLEHGFDVPRTGRLAGHWKQRYWDAHT